MSSLGQQAVSARQFSSKVIFEKVLVRTSRNLRRNRKRCLKFREVLETQEHAQALQDTKERRQREPQSERRYVLLTSELQLVHSIYMMLFFTTSLSKLHRKRQSEQTGKTPSWVSDLAQMTYKPPHLQFNANSNERYQLPWNEHQTLFRPSKTCETKHNTPLLKTVKQHLRVTLSTVTSQESIELVFTEDF